jgi:hypothetical protein
MNANDPNSDSNLPDMKNCTTSHEHLVGFRIGQNKARRLASTKALDRPGIR